MKSLRPIGSAAALICLCSCAVGPNYHQPDVAPLTPTEWHWKAGEPHDAVPKGDWWAVFHDPVLDGLELLATTNNQNLITVLARVDQARAAARVTRSQFFPELSFDPAAKRERTSGHLPTPVPFHVPSAYLNTFSLPLDLSYEIDLWGRVRRSFEAARAQAQASLADSENTLLTLTADVAVDYFLLRSLEADLAALRRTVALRQESLTLLQARFAAGAIPELDLARAKTELAVVRTDLAESTRQQAETLHALALLCGRPASSFVVPEAPFAAVPPTVPAGLPSSVLERRPDIASAERNLAAKNARIGVARSAYFPALRLTGQAGYLSAEADDIFAWDSRVWSIGPSVSLPLFNAGRTHAEVQQAQAAYQEALADYRQAVLTAFKEVEDSLAQVALRREQAAALEEALLATRRVAELAKARYEAGATTYLEVVDAERDELQQERQSALLQGQRFAAAVHLIKALGGGWPDAQGLAARQD